MKANLKQGGFALIIFTLIITLSALAYFFRNLDVANLRFTRDADNQKILALARESIISHSIARFGVGERPGDMPRPDYIIEAPSTNYDGNSDGGCLDSSSANGLPQVNSGVNMRCLGRLPWRTIGMSIPSGTQNDVNGSMPWYAASANLVDSTCLTVLNSNILNLVNNPPPAPLDCSGATLPYPWLTVRDSNGNVVSNRVAVVVIIPGTAIVGQSRPSLPLNGTTAYLDAITVPAGCAVPCVPGTYSNADFDNSFILHDDKNITTINDKLIFITIEELIQAAERRAAQEAARQLNIYYTNSSAAAASRFFPYAAELGDPNNVCEQGNIEGFIPVQPAFASCTSTTACNLSFPMTEVQFELTSGSYTSGTGFCSSAANICTCTGVGSCNKSSAPTAVFSCNANGACQSTGTNPAGLFIFNYAPKLPDLTVVSGACAISAVGQVECSDIGTFSSPPTNCTHPRPGLANLPDWFLGNRWQDLIYYQFSSQCEFATPGCVGANLTVGGKPNVRSLVAAVGARLDATELVPNILQGRPSTNIDDYLDSVLNTDGDLVFDRDSKLLTNTYNDQILVVAP